MRTPFVSRIAFVAIAAITVVASRAHAQSTPPIAPEDPSATAAARGLGIEGVRLAEAGNCQDAIVKLERAERLHHAPTTLGRLGECHIALGKLVLGSEQLQRVVREPLAASAPHAFVAAKVRAKRVLDEVLPRIAKLHLHVVVSPSPQSADSPDVKADVKPTVTLDGAVLSPEWLDIDRPIDPGTYTVAASAEGYVPVTNSVALIDGERSEITLTLTTPAPPPETPPIEPPAPAIAEDSAVRAPAASAKSQDANLLASTSEPPCAGPQRAIGIALLGVGGAAVVVGSIFGLRALDTKSHLDDACGPGKACPPDQQHEISSLKTQSVLATVGFIAGGVGLAAGTVVLLTTPSSTTKPSSALSVGPMSVSWHGHF